jgi:putative heme iron utilization protein
MPEAPFTPDVVDAVVRHMNDDHAGDALTICRALGGAPTATAARTVGLDEGGLVLLATVDGGEREVRIPWEHTPADRADIRREVVRMHERATARTTT